MNKRVNLPAAIFGRKVLIPVALSAVMAATAMLVFVPKTSATAMPEQPAAALTVTVTAASQAQWPATLEASGAIAPWQEAVIGAMFRLAPG